MMGGAKARYDSIKAFSETDFTEDLKVINMPTLVMHGDDDQIVPIADSAPLSTKLLVTRDGLFYRPREEPSCRESARRRPASRRTLHLWQRSFAGQRILSSEGCRRETDRGLRHPLHHHPLDPVHGIPRRHRRFKCGRDQDFARTVPAHRCGRRCCHRRRCGARAALTRAVAL